MKYNLSILLFLSLLFPSNLKNWIDKKSNLIQAEKYVVTLKYSISKNKKTDIQHKINDVVYYNVNKDSSVLKLNDRILLLNKNSTKIIDENSKQIFIESNNKEFQQFQNKLLAIFLDDNYKIIKQPDNHYILSLNDYFLNLNVSYDNQGKVEPIVDIVFFQNPYVVQVKKIAITSYDPIPYSNDMWDDYEVFNLID